MNDTELKEAALHLIELLDKTTYEAYASGEITHDKYRLMTKKITDYQRITENILYTWEKQPLISNISNS